MNTTNSTLNTTALNKDYYDRQLLECQSNQIHTLVR